MQQWEYMVLTGIVCGHPRAELGTSYPRLYKFTLFGLDLVTDFQGHKRRQTKELDEVAAMVAAIGEEGWELVEVASAPLTNLGGVVTPNVTTQGIIQTLYFKRALPEQQSSQGGLPSLPQRS